MKFLLVLVVVLAGVWLWRSNRQSDKKMNQAPKAGPEPLEMVRCALCSVHVPAADAVQGKKGTYCSAEHRDRAEP